MICDTRVDDARHQWRGGRADGLCEKGQPVFPKQPQHQRRCRASSMHMLQPGIGLGAGRRAGASPAAKAPQYCSPHLRRLAAAAQCCWQSSLSKDVAVWKTPAYYYRIALNPPARPWACFWGERRTFQLVPRWPIEALPLSKTSGNDTAGRCTHVTADSSAAICRPGFVSRSARQPCRPKRRPSCAPLFSSWW